MNITSKRLTAFGITGAAATALIIGGFVAPAQAAQIADGAGTLPVSSSDSSSSQSHTDLINDLFQVSGTDATGNGVLGNDTSVGGVGNGGLVNGGVGNGGVGNGGVVNGPLVDDSLTSDIGDVASGTEAGNNASAGSGNTATAPVDAPVQAPVDTNTGTDLGGVSADETGTDLGGVSADDTGTDTDATATGTNVVDDVLSGLGLGR